MKKTLVVIFLLFSFNAYAEKITYEGNKVIIDGEKTYSENQVERVAYFERLKKSEELVNAEIKRKHELNIEVAKFKNALMLERAGASNINVSSYSINRNETVNSLNTGRIRNLNNSTK